MTDLDNLIAAVEAGHETALYAALRAIASAARDKGEYWPAHDATKAFDGSLDAAHRLHEALLPGWVVENLGNACIDGTGGWNVRLNAPDYLETFLHSAANAETPARAWLLAILRALKAQGGDA